MSRKTFTIMTISSLSATLGAALLLAGSPVLVSAAQTTVKSPIVLTKVEITQSYGSVNEFYPGLVTVAFTNENPAPATDIIFDLESDGKLLDRYEDVGTYPQGKVVRHSFQDIQIDNDQKLVVEQATFADGSVWSPSEATFAPVAPAQSHAPTAEDLFPYRAADQAS